MTYYGPLKTTLLFDSTDIQNLDGIAINDMSGIFAPATRRGSHDTIPGRAGQLGAELPLDAFTFTISITVLGDSHADMYANLAAAADALKGTNGLGQLERRIDNAGATMAGYVAHTAAGQFASLNSFSLLNTDIGQTELTFVNLDGAWWDGSGWLIV